MKLKRFCTVLFLIGLLTLTCVIKKYDSIPPLPKECAFCNESILINQIFFQDDLVTALLSHKPVNNGHSLIIPRRHVERFEDLTTDEVQRMMNVIKKIHTGIQALYQTSSYILLQKNGPEAFQTVPHVHFHYIPRLAGNYSQLGFLWNMMAAGIKSPLTGSILKEQAKCLKNVLQQLDNRNAHAIAV